VRRRRGGRKRCKDHPSPYASENGNEVIDAGVGTEGDDVPWLESVALQARGYRIDASVKLGVRHLGVVEHDGQAVRPLRGLPPHHVCVRTERLGDEIIQGHSVRASL
jgi:hypothetical protein